MVLLGLYSSGARGMAAEDRTKISIDKYFFAKCVSEHTGLSTWSKSSILISELPKKPIWKYESGTLEFVPLSKDIHKYQELHSWMFPAKSPRTCFSDELMVSPTRGISCIFNNFEGCYFLYRMTAMIAYYRSHQLKCKFHFRN